VVAPLIVTPVFHRWGWRAAFWFTGIVGVAWLAMWMVISRRPEIRATGPAATATTPGPRARDRELWAFLCAYALGALPLGFVLYVSSLYLAKPLGCSQEFIGKVLWIPPLGWELGYFIWGWLADRRKGSLRNLFLICAALSLPFAAIPLFRDVAVVLFLLFLAMFAAAGFIVLPVIYSNRIYSADHAGFLAGAAAGAWSAMVAITMPFFGKLFDTSDFRTAFLIAAVFPVAGITGWAFLSRNCARNAATRCLD
jgi:ACS family hexuronate transporter-like MFS transporter